MMRLAESIAEFRKKVLLRVLAKFAESVAGVWRRLHALGPYRFAGAHQLVRDMAIRLKMMRMPAPCNDDYSRRVHALHRELRVPRDYARRGLPFYREAPVLVAVPCGLDGKQCLMTPATRFQWTAMQDAAASAGITLLVRWAFRSVDEQAQLIRAYLLCGGDIDQVLSRVAAPGYSEHHTGQALDLDSVPAEKAFETTPAFEWLCSNAGGFKFQLSYPRDNAYGIIYEPWHWYCQSEEASSPLQRI